MDTRVIYSIETDTPNFIAIREIYVVESVGAPLFALVPQPNDIFTAGFVSIDRNLIGNLLNVPNLLPLTRLQVKQGEHILNKTLDGSYTIPFDAYLYSFWEIGCTLKYLGGNRASVYERILYFYNEDPGEPDVSGFDTGIIPIQGGFLTFYASPIEYSVETEILLWNRYYTYYDDRAIFSISNISLPLQKGYFGSVDSDLSLFNHANISHTYTDKLPPSQWPSPTNFGNSADALGFGRSNVHSRTYFTSGSYTYQVYLVNVEKMERITYLRPFPVDIAPIEIRIPLGFGPFSRGGFLHGDFLYHVGKLDTEAYLGVIVDGSWEVGDSLRRIGGEVSGPLPVYVAPGTIQESGASIPLSL